MVRPSQIRLPEFNPPMLVYKDKTRRMCTRDWLAELSPSARDLGLQNARNLLIEFGEFEAAVEDAHNSARDDCDPLTDDLQATTTCLGVAVLECASMRWVAATDAYERASALVRSLERRDLPAFVTRKIAEGYAYWGLYPEQYALAAQTVFEKYRPIRVMVLGLRSIGCSLAGIVRAALELEGVEVRSMSWRPRGHPFARSFELGTSAVREVTARRDWLYLVVDEGPGLSGSSLTGAVTTLERLGVPVDSIVLLPSYECDGSQFVNAEARMRWGTCARVVGNFDPGAFLNRGERTTIDISAGAWRRRPEFRSNAFVPVHPQHERRKYLVVSSQGVPTRIHRFCGLGRHGAEVHARAIALQECGMISRVGGFAHGLLELHFVSGEPLIAGNLDATSVRRIADYVAFRRSALRLGSESDLAALVEMAIVNANEAFDDDVSSYVTDLAEAAAHRRNEAVCVDGRMLPQEWISTTSGLVKVDAFDHGDDHFYPGPCDIAWDLAGATEELRLDEAMARLLTSRYVALSGDDDVLARLPFYRVAYLAFRLGYTTLACKSLEGSLDGERFLALRDRHRRQLSRLLIGRKHTRLG